MQTISYIRQFFRELSIDIFQVSTTLFKIMIPMVILIKIAEELGGIELLGKALGPVMETLNLTEGDGLVMAATITTNLYGGLVVLADVGADNMTIAQATTLGCLMLIIHGLPIEVAIAKKAGVKVWVILLVRLGGGFLFASMLYHLYEYGGLLQAPANNLLSIEPGETTGLWGWVLGQLKSFGVIFLVITALLFLLKLLKVMGIERLMAIALSPLLRLLGIGKEATSFAIIGITLGLSFGGGLLINEAKKGHIKARDIFTTIVLLSLLHSLIEDTLLIMLIGADFHSIFWGRLLFALGLVAIISRLMAMMDEVTCQRWFYRSVAAN